MQRVVRQVGVVIERDAVGGELEHLVDRLLERAAVLLGQAVDEVHVDGLEAVFAGGLHRGLRHLEGLDAVHGLLDVGVEVLDAEGHAVEAQIVQVLDLVGVAGARVNLDRELAALGEREALRERLHHERELVVREEGRRAAAEVELLELGGARDGLLHEVGFAADHLDVLGAAGVVARDDLVAAAVEADVVAEGNVHVEREVGGLLRVSAAGEGLAVVFGTEARVESVGGRIRRVAGGGHVEFAQEVHFGQFNAAGCRIRHLRIFLGL